MRFVGNFRGGRKPKFEKEIRKKIVKIIQKTPREYGIPVATWSIRLLKAFLEKRGIKISRARLHQVIGEEGITWRKARMEIKKRDKEYAKKKLRILRLIKEKPPYGVVFFFDEKGPVGIKRSGGYSWIIALVARNLIKNVFLMSNLSIKSLRITRSM